jgi:hypothetical protein
MLFGSFDHLPTKRLGGLERSRDELVERDALRAQISIERIDQCVASTGVVRNVRSITAAT